MDYTNSIKEKSYFKVLSIKMSFFRILKGFIVQAQGEEKRALRCQVRIIVGAESPKGIQL